jgi:hypothetical protein
MSKRPLFQLILLLLVGVFALIGLFFTLVFIGMQFGLFNVPGAIAERNRFFTEHINLNDQTAAAIRSGCTSASPCLWNETPEWAVVREGLRKDKEVINRVAQETGVPARLIAAVVVPEQLRFFTSEREVFKRYFEPLKILGSLSQFSLGVSGIKEDTARAIEQHASDPSSSFYPGVGYDTLLVYPKESDPTHERFLRLTDAKDHYYSYLYTAIFLKEIMSQWRIAGYDIARSPGITTTLFNIGFVRSIPKPDPQIGGARIEIGGTPYTFGELGAKFYDSEELRDIFPY